MVDQRFFEIPISEVWSLCEHYLFETSLLFGVKIHAFVLMSNHYHLLVTTPESNLSDAMEFFQSRVARGISAAKGNSSVRFQARYRWSIINSPQYYANATAYVYLNPVRAGILTDPGLYKFSTLNGLLGHSRLSIPICTSSLDDLDISKDPFAFYRWSKITMAATNPKKVQRALRSAFFNLAK
jgi:putative transposase